MVFSLVFCFQFSVFSFQFSVFSFQFSVFSFQFSVFEPDCWSWLDRFAGLLGCCLALSGLWIGGGLIPRAAP